MERTNCVVCGEDYQSEPCCPQHEYVQQLEKRNAELELYETDCKHCGCMMSDHGYAARAHYCRGFEPFNPEESDDRQEQTGRDQV